MKQVSLLRTQKFLNKLKMCETQYRRKRDIRKKQTKMGACCSLHHSQSSIEESEWEKNIRAISVNKLQRARTTSLLDRERRVGFVLPAIVIHQVPPVRSMSEISFNAELLSPTMLMKDKKRRFTQ